jgi:hypothetical protein
MLFLLDTLVVLSIDLYGKKSVLGISIVSFLLLRTQVRDVMSPAHFCAPALYELQGVDAA